MSAQNESPAVAVARAHIEAWTNHDFDTARRMLAGDVHVTATSTDPALPRTDLTGASNYMEGLTAYAQPIVPGSLHILASTGDERNALLTLTVKMAGAHSGLGPPPRAPGSTSWTRTARSRPNKSSSTSPRTDHARGPGQCHPAPAGSRPTTKNAQFS
jgi:SnoaL-like domain